MVSIASIRKTMEETKAHNKTTFNTFHEDVKAGFALPENAVEMLVNGNARALGAQNVLVILPSGDELSKVEALEAIKRIDSMMTALMAGNTHSQTLYVMQVAVQNLREAMEEDNS